MGENAGRPSTDRNELRRRARQHVEEGAVTEGYTGDREAVIGLLNDALATEIICALRYRRHYFVAQRLALDSVVNEFMEHSTQELDHADRLAGRIVQLGGEPDFDPSRCAARAHSEYVEGVTLADMIREDLVAERIAIDSYREVVAFIGETDPTTRRLFEQILEVEEEHADDMADLLAIETGNTADSTQQNGNRAGSAIAGP
jgi:bacterioferritin